MARFLHITEPPTRPLLFDEPGVHVVYFRNISGKYVFEMKTKGVELYIFGLFTGRNADKFEIETVQHHKAGGAYSDLFIKGVFDDNSVFRYQGLIRIEKAAQQSHAYQKNQNLVLSGGVSVDSNPFLEILANDVFCTHGSTTGKLNEEELFYLRSRGFSAKQARDMLVEGFATEVIDRLKEKVPDAQVTL
ncbi:MAG: SufD family Fe-S cluster assembly protein [Patescibacteria group bacterium]|nr:SufD family Fe-S cluster assembly protein [Patescibacteria group bacterium]